MAPRWYVCPGPDLELWALEKAGAYFQSVFGREVVAIGT